MFAGIKQASAMVPAFLIAVALSGFCHGQSHGHHRSARVPAFSRGDAMEATHRPKQSGARVESDLLNHFFDSHLTASQ